MPSQAYRNELYAQNSGAVEVDLIRVRLDSETRYYAASPEAVVSRGITYQAAGFILPLPADSGTSAPASTLVFDATDREIILILRTQNQPIEIEHEKVLIDNPDVVEIGPLHYEVQESSWVGGRAQLLLTFEPILNEPAPYGRCDPTSTPGLFR